jgi:hypothetical protein
VKPPAPAGSLGELAPTTMLTAEQVGAFVGVSGRTIRRAGIPCVTIRPRVTRFFARDVLAWLESQRNGRGA